jgi:hypothetical protein
MTLIEISKVLENTGYMTTIDEDKFIKAGIKTTSKIMPGLNMPKEVFYISLYKKTIVLIYQYYQLDIRKVFDTVDELLNFIKREFRTGSMAA